MIGDEELMGGVISPLPSGVVSSDTVRGEIGDALGENLGEDEELLLLFPFIAAGGDGLLGDNELDLLLLVSGVGYTGYHEVNGDLGDEGGGA